MSESFNTAWLFGGWPNILILLRTGIILFVAIILGTAIGLERQWRQRSAGLRTNVLVTVAAAAFSDLGLQMRGVEGSTQIVAYVVSGIGFLGAGVIVKDGTNVRGLNTAATLWSSAAVGAFCGTGHLAEAVLVALAVLGANTLLRPLVNWVNRRPITSDTTEALYQVHAICRPDAVADVRDLLAAELERASYPIREVEVENSSDELVELAATLVPTTAEPAELDAVVTALEASPHVRSATWTVEAMV